MTCVLDLKIHSSMILSDAELWMNSNVCAFDGSLLKFTRTLGIHTRGNDGC